MALLENFPLSTALRSGLCRYNTRTFRDDAIAGLIVSLIALPLSMALSIAVGLPPRHGLYTAIVAGIVAALFGGSKTQVSGPTAAFVVIVAPIVQQFGLHGIIWCQIMAGVILIAFGTLRLGKLINYVPYPVTTGFTAGIAVTIGTLALNDFFGLGIEHLTGPFVQKAYTIGTNMSHVQLPDMAVGLVTLLGIIFFPKVTTKIPSPALGITLGALLAWILTHYGFHVDTINTRFSYQSPDGLTHPGIPPYPPTLTLPGSGDPLFAIPTYSEFRTLFSSSLVIAALAALESLLSATVADSMARTRHDPNAELNGIGIANIFSGLASGIPATGAIARTATNIHSGGKTPISSIIHALLILLYMMTLAPLISTIPMAALAALLLMTAWRMSHVHQFIRIMKIAPKSDVVVLLSCFLLTVFIDMVAGVTVGMIAASILFIKSVADSTNSTTVPQEGGNDALPPHTAVYRIQGPLFFGSVERLLELESIDFINDDIKKLIIDLSQVPMIDMTGMVGMKSLLSTVAHKDRTVILCGKQNITHSIIKKISGTPIAPHIHAVTTWKEAVAHK